MAELAVDVVVAIAGEDVLAGRLWSHRGRGVESATFAYDDGYLARAGAYTLDPALRLTAGQQQTPTLLPIGDRAALIVDRFDRVEDLRLGYVSAMTMLEAGDGDGGSYLEIAEVIERHSPRASEDLRELWRRIAFSILISNTDDHLRNHGFLRLGAGWSLSPAFDLNPDPSPGRKRLSTAIDLDDTTASIDTLMSVAGHVRLSDVDARRVLREVADATGRWRTTAREMGLGRGEIERMSPAFEHDQASRASRA